ncbi:GNAT family N-acetyltransferase [Pelomonas sp. SE-A7]|uniref:GNAT family N-acetyltransferase n=1 Tax=Pelomonas sp. SE-A7 TaxID=3054953 RepID=UPI00259CF2F9|nr:GNAT family N-acetyltransferase [Pelomonas sp. SE-A7]MDM4766494.1 GNAT family N-acetyltransferase [Pelomonas sp. SE-A7]
MLHLLDNLMWHALSGTQARFAVGSGGVRRMAPGFSPLIGFENPDQPDLQALSALAEPGESFYTGVWSGPVPADWRIEAEATMFSMFWDAACREHDEAPEAVPLAAEHAQQALELALLTKPGPFGLRTLELGDYFGCFDEQGRLMAMAGERMQAEQLREISGVCTHPDFQGRGLARRLMLKLVRRQLQRGQLPVLHVMSANAGARGLYERMGFRYHREVVVRVIAKTADQAAD